MLSFLKAHTNTHNHYFYSFIRIFIMANTKTNTRFISPCGKSLYAKVQTPDTRFDAEGIYHLDLLVDPDKAQDMIQNLESILDEFYNTDDDVASALAKGRKLTKAPVYEEMQDGTYRFRFKQRAKLKDKDGNVYDKSVVVFDAKVHPLDKEIGNGSVVKVSYSCKPYYVPATRTVGVATRLIGVQVLKLVEFGGSDDCGFTVEDGYETDTAGFTSTTNASNADPSPLTAKSRTANSDDGNSGIDEDVADF